MIAQNVRLDEFYHIIKKNKVIWVKKGRLSISVTPCSPRLKIGMLSDRSFLPQNAILTLCGPISHQNKENKKKIAKIA